MKWLCRVVLIAVALMTCSHGTRACKPLSERMAEGVSLVGVVDVTHLSTSGMNLYIEVDNDTCHRLVVSRAEIDVVEDGENVVTISLRDKVVVRVGAPRKCSSHCASTPEAALPYIAHSGVPSRPRMASR